MRSEERKTLRETRCELGRYNADVMSTAPISLQTSEEFRIFAERCMHFMNLFAQHSGTEIWDAMKSFKALSAALFAKCGAQQGLEGSDPDRARQWIDSVAARAGQSAKPRAAGS